MRARLRLSSSGAAGLALLALAACDLGAETPPAARAVPEIEELTVRVVAEYPHDPAAFTQGLVWHGNRLYESTGSYGESTLRRVELESGRVELRVDLPDALFGEGLERVGERLVQLTWQEQLARVYALDSLELLDELPYRGEGWGLCLAGDRLVRSDGTDTLTLHDPRTFERAGRLRVTMDDRPVYYLNELECAGGEIYANVWQSDRIVRIDPASGRVTARIDASSLLPEPERRRVGVLNGIAHRAERGTFLLTGKNWPRLFEVELVPAEMAGSG